MTLPIPSNVFADGELTNEASWFSRIFAAINTIYATLTALPRVQHGTFTITWSAANTATGTITFPQAFAGIPDIAASCGPLSTTAVIFNVSALSATQFSYRAALTTGTGSGTAAGYYVATYA